LDLQAWPSRGVEAVRAVRRASPGPSALQELTSVEMISVVVPCYNEMDGIQQLEEKLLPVAERISARHPIELIFIDDGSTDETFRVLQETFGKHQHCRIIKHARNLNLGGAIRTGITESKGAWIANIASDCTYDPPMLEPMIAAMEDGADLVTVSPYHPNGRVDGVPAHRLALSKGLTFLYRLVLRKRIYTFTAMNRMYRREICAGIQSPASDFTSVAEMMIKALKQNLRVVELPAVLSVRQFGESKLKTGRVIRAHIRLLRRLIFAPSTFTR